MAHIFQKQWWLKKQELAPPVKQSAPPVIAPIDNAPGRRISEPPGSTYNDLLTNLSENYRIINRDFSVETIKLLRRLAKCNPDISQALHNIVTLGNTGHKIFFDPGVPPDQVDAMRQHVNASSADWMAGQPNIHGMINKMWAQLVLTGALSNEWVPKFDLTGVESCLLVAPEEIVFVLDRRKSKYLPYQQVDRLVGKRKGSNLIKLNINTYKYFALNGDTEIPYGWPPYMPVIPRIPAQKNMLDSLDHLAASLGILGLMQVLMTKPDRIGGETDEKYAARLTAFLNDTRKNLMGGLKDGIVVAYDEDTKIEIKNPANRDTAGAKEVFNLNESQIFSALKSDPTLAGRDYSSSESQISVLFMKMLSELKNGQNIIKANLEFGISLHLRLAGFKFKYLKIQFNNSTITDELKYQQGQEYKIKNVISKYLLGLIGQDQAADELDYETPFSPKPLVAPEILAGSKPEVEKTDADKKTKNKSAKKQRDKAKPTGSKK